MGVINSVVILQIGIFAGSGTAFGQFPQFIREKIELTIIDESFLIEGIYYFLNVNSTSIKRSLFYPFPVDSVMHYPDSIRVINVREKRNLSFFKTKSGIYFPIEIPPQKTVKYKVCYVQKTKKNRAEYILTTTQKWGRALEKAEFIIKLPSEFELIHLTYEYDEIVKENNNIIYKINKENFMPIKNLIVEWARRK